MIHKTILFLFLGGLILSTAPLIDGQIKNSIEVDSKIDRVMVYHDRALVTRIARIDKVSAGTSEIIFRNLPVMMQDDSVRAKVSGGTDAKIIDVEVRTIQLEKAPELKIRQLQDKMQSLLDEKKRTQNRTKVLQLEYEFLTGVRNTFLGIRTENKSDDRHYPGAGDRQKTGIADYESMLKYLNDKFLANSNNMFKEETSMRETDTQIGLVKSELSKLNEGQSASPNKKIVKVTVDTQKQSAITVELSYLNYRVNWKPGYDIRVFIDDNKTEFTGYGVIDQSSGEDWLNAQISYSTAQPAVSGYLPELLPLYATDAKKINYGNTRQDIASQNAANIAVLDSGAASGYSSPDTPAEAVDTSEDVTTENVAGSMVFHVPRRSDIPSDGSPHRTAISRQTMPVRFEYSSVPRLSPHAFLQAVGKNNMSVPILKGNLNIFMGNDFVGSSNTDSIMPGEDFELTLSVNDNIRVSRILEEKGEKSGGFLSSSQKTNFSFLIKVENYTGKDIVMNIFDQIPVSETEEIEITNVAFSQKPHMQSKKGIIQWQLNMKPKEVAQINFSFSVNIPKGMELAFFRTNLAPKMFIQGEQSRQIQKSGNRYEQSADEMQREFKAPAMKKR
ncbi:MAG TPA: mucoidy inhibitor MuiA family protein [Spirochaetota bacterium]|nr:mucoidy inhibitor MuiA family protein [Spirochaetota bacterium]